MGPFLARLTGLSGFDAALPMNTGAEAVETAIKLARKWAYKRKRVPRDEARIVVCRNNFHGRTTTIVGFSTEEQYRDDFGPFDQSFDIVDFGDTAALAQAIVPETAAFLVEPIQAEAGILMPPSGYLTAVRKICRERNVLMMLDEIQTGLGRTGKLFAFEHEDDARPDVLVLGKALGGGVYPVSAVLADREQMELFQPGDHGSTFGGNPLAAAVGRAALDVIVDEGLPERAGRLGQRLLSGLKTVSSRHVREIRGKGLLAGIELRREFSGAHDIALQLLELGVLAKDTHEQVLRIAPPLVVDDATIDWLIDRIRRVLS